MDLHTHTHTHNDSTQANISPMVVRPELLALFRNTDKLGQALAGAPTILQDQPTSYV